jgi:hypothetical protein
MFTIIQMDNKCSGFSYLKKPLLTDLQPDYSGFNIRFIKTAYISKEPKQRDYESK